MLLPSVTYSRAADEMTNSVDSDQTRLFAQTCMSKYNESLCREPRHDKMCLREFPTRPDTNRPAQPQKLARVLKFWL